MLELFSIVQLEVKNNKGTTLVYAQGIEGLSILGQPPIIDFTEDPWKADRPTLVQDYHGRIVHVLTDETGKNGVYGRLRQIPGCKEGVQTIKVSIVEISRQGLNVTSSVVKESPLFVIQSIAHPAVRVIAVDF